MNKSGFSKDELLEEAGCKNWEEAHKIVSEFSGGISPTAGGGWEMIDGAQMTLGDYEHVSDSWNNEEPIKFFQQLYYCNLMEYTPDCTCGGGDTCSSCHWWLATAEYKHQLIALVRTIIEIQVVGRTMEQLEQ